jgi:uncharacterized membrane protein YfcA
MLLGLLFFIVAAFYASIGFGGGTSYIALLVLWGLPYAAIPVLALACNIVVVSGNSFHYVRAGYFNKRLVLPFLVGVPFAYLGGKLPIDKETFAAILFVSLLVAGIRMLVQHRRYDEEIESYRAIPLWISASLGSTLGFLAGITGIGGGIFLAPALYNLRAGSPKQIAATTSVFILLNSIAGLAGQMQKHVDTDIVLDYWYLPVLVLAGGQLGNQMMLKFIPARITALLTAVLVLFVAGRLGLHIWQ